VIILNAEDAEDMVPSRARLIADIEVYTVIICHTDLVIFFDENESGLSLLN
jgi:hypothetical protein